MAARQHAPYSTRAVSLVLIAAFAGVALWLFAPNHAADWVPSGSAALPSSLRVDGDVAVMSEGDVVTHLSVPLALRGDEGIILDDGFRLRAETELSDSAHAAVPATYAVSWLDGNGDLVLDPGEHAVLSVDLPQRTSVHPDNPLTLVLRPSEGSSLIIEDVLE